MASLEQWTEWRDEYLTQFSFVIDDAPIRMAAHLLKKNDNIDLNIEKAWAFIFEAIEKGYIDYNAPDFFFKTYLFAFMFGRRRWYSSIKSVKDADEDYKAAVAKGSGISDVLSNFDSYFSYASWFINYPIMDVCHYFLRNNPLLYLSIISEYVPDQLNNINLSYCKLSQEQLFNYFCSMMPYGLYRLLADINCPCAEDVFQVAQKKNFRSFKVLCRDYHLDFSEVSKIAGVIENSGSIHLTDTPEVFAAKGKVLNSMMSLSSSEPLSARLSSFFRKEFIIELLPFEMTDEEAQKLALMACDVSFLCFPYISKMSEEEQFHICRVLESPFFSAYHKLIQYIALASWGHIPSCFSVILTTDELNRFLPHLVKEITEATIKTNNDTHLPIEKEGTIVEEGDNEDNDATDEDLRSQTAQVSEESIKDAKTLASRWMTEPYHRMSDDVLVEIISQKIWPQLINEVDNLQWTPSKRALPSFQKAKNMLAACLLFHALELAKIAKLPKQEESGRYDYEGLYGEKDRAQADVYTTSNLRAGVTHAKKKYNDTLPVGYMEALKRFIPESDMPGRTTSRTYLKLLNYWIKTSFESTSEYKTARELLDEAQRKKDLGAQNYLFDNNQKRLRAMLKKWWKELPDLFNVPI